MFTSKKSYCYLSIILVFIVFFQYGCKKNYVEINKSTLTMGDYNNVNTIYYNDTVVGIYIQPQHYQIDIDNNGIYDIEFECTYAGSPGTGPKYGSSVKSLSPNVAIFGYHNTDTIFIHKDTSVVPDTISIKIYHKTTYTCSRMSPNDSINSITPSYKTTPLNNQDNIQLNDTYHSTSIKLQDTETGSIIYSGGNIDTTFYSVVHFKNNCFSFPMNQPKYIGVKLINQNKLGWIKINLLDRHKIYIEESAIQK
ncbi:MAG: hypothetical protein OQJ96_04200 [Flavobacteriales bacterium]|nr:hypothetical protein [Flavobacteriales bacterium]MCW8912027.1 hypothetical protein [Flavobacteriales bacterium]MCW8936667.1 hypothetical protein [Flavobacteriales bacterium]MCW8939566.1 hypothetical protein [Flavobacteriales bacterium]MCW8968465.1 hypothetical protein [Flavobacteriales bacterium]